MSKSAAASRIQDRLLSFEVGGSIYALPIACVVEVSEVEPLSFIPTLPAETGGVMNHHGDALAVLRRSVLLDVDQVELAEPTNVLVFTARPTGGLRLGMEVDRIVGLVDGAAAVAHDDGPIAERRSIDDRVVFVLDPQRLADRAREVIERSLARGE